MADDQNDAPPASVTRLPVGFKKPPGEDGRVLKVVDQFDSRHGCNHSYVWDSNGGLGGRMRNVTYLIREGETEVECSNCATKLDPMWVLRQMARRESDYERKREVAQAEMARLAERERTECQHCGRMTKISRRKSSRG